MNKTLAYGSTACNTYVFCYVEQGGNRSLHTDNAGIGDYLFDRGYTVHCLSRTGFGKHLDAFNLINMNGRLYDPILGRFLSPDNYVQDATGTQSYNRYSYCLNNPLSYNDPTGDFWNLIIGAAIGGTINWITHGAEFTWEGLGYFGIGAAAGALGAGIGAGVGIAAQGGSFAAGFMGTTTAVAGGGFLGGVSAGFTNGFITGTGNALMQGEKFGNSLTIGLKSGTIQGLIGGSIAGTGALISAKSFWTGDVTFNDKLAFLLENNEAALREEYGDKLIDEIKVKKNILMRDAGRTIPLESDLTGLDFNGSLGHRSNIQLSSKTLNAYFRNRDMRAVSVLYHEFFHAQDMYIGLDKFVTSSLGEEMGSNLLEFHAYERCFRIFGTQMGSNQINEWIRYTNLVFPY